MTENSLVTFIIKSEGKAIADVLQVSEIEVYNNVSGASQARLVLIAHSTDVTELTDAVEFETGKEIEISLGYDNANKTVFQGEVTGQSFHLNQNKGVAFEVVCESFSQEQMLPPDNISHASTVASYILGKDIFSSELHIDPNVSTQVMGGFGVHGSNMLVPGCIVKLTGVGKAFDGNQYVSGVNHHLADGHWMTNVNIGIVNEAAEEPEDLTTYDDAAEELELVPEEDYTTYDNPSEALEIVPENDFMQEASMTEDQEVIEIKDKSGNAITLSPEGIRIESNTSLHIKAEGELIINGAIISIN